MLDRLRRALRGADAEPAQARPQPSAEPQRVKQRAAILDPAARVVNLVGESHYQDALARLGGGSHGGGVRQPDHVAGFLPEPTNPVDPEAVQVQIDGQVVGYLARADARAYRPLIDRLAANGLRLGCHARLVGGWDRDGERGSIGVRLLIGSPDDCWREVAEVVGPGPGPSAAAPTPKPASVVRPGAVAVQPVALPEGYTLVGKTVCFTGPSRYGTRGEVMSRDRQEGIATGAGMVVLPRVTKALDVLVVSSAALQTGKTTLAAKYGTLVIDEATLWTTLGIALDPLDGQVGTG
jgi:hypothetical protein